MEAVRVALKDVKKKVRVCFYLTRQVRDGVADQANKRGMSRSCLIDNLVREAMAQNEDWWLYDLGGKPRSG